ncbi:SDR family oxidoreductase [Kitasatospora viridis]|uniref:NAD(P)-dependent dehydrogenase (Short-subunit alcohol dehydrogenase family) n=1 Tax=Kitasatospora viridis TaxID=281105 RepID=A0A561TSU7_9ACTN|nr:SDR family oxidoreductase [Kitasatospora viridis]TWF90194.1 NAD(P)-dependent dehydrogenase (short-subunit alcohol dehydrogenase family) [Kitasatospora viridis]
MSTFSGQRVVVLGGSSGIGEATAAAFAKDGAEVVITGRDQQRLDAAVARIGGNTKGHAVDAVDQAAVAALFAELGTVDHLVLGVSGSAGSGAFAELDLGELARGFDAKFWPQVRSLQAALPHLRTDGSVTFITAGSSRAAFPGTAGLAAINGALDAMVPPLAVELAPLRVNAVSPGVIDTPWWDRVPEEQRKQLFEGLAAVTPVGRVGRPEDVAQAIQMLAANTFVTGIVLDCNGGTTLASGR